MCRTDHILFIAAGAFHRNRPSDLMPELQGRFPIRVELNDLTKDDFVRILKEPKSSLTRQYEALLQTEGIELVFTDDAIEALATHAHKVNQSTQNIGARRLYTILERCSRNSVSRPRDEDGAGGDQCRLRAMSGCSDSPKTRISASTFCSSRTSMQRLDVRDPGRGRHRAARARALARCLPETIDRLP